MKVDMTFRRAKPLLIPSAHHIDLILCGTGGTGSWLAPHLVRVARALLDQGKDVSVRFIDPDVVEEKNLVRQNFCDVEVGMQKAVSLAMRFGMAWRVPVEAIPERFTADHVPTGMNGVALLIGAVDNAAARITVNDLLRRNRDDAPPTVYYLDIGNDKESGQCLLGTAFDVVGLRGAFSTAGICSALPSPLHQDPTLRDPKPEEQADQSRLSCVELALLNLQSPAINAVMASIAAEYVWALLVTGGLKRFATFVSLRHGSMQSSWTTPEQVAHSVQLEPQFFVKNRTRSSGA